MSGSNSISLLYIFLLDHNFVLIIVQRSYSVINKGNTKKCSVIYMNSQLSYSVYFSYPPEKNKFNSTAQKDFFSRLTYICVCQKLEWFQSPIFDRHIKTYPLYLRKFDFNTTNFIISSVLHYIFFRTSCYIFLLRTKIGDSNVKKKTDHSSCSSFIYPFKMWNVETWKKRSNLHLPLFRQLEYKMCSLGLYYYLLFD